MDAWTRLREHVLSTTEPQAPHVQATRRLTRLLEGHGAPSEWRECLAEWRALAGSSTFRSYLLSWSESQRLGLSEDNVDALLAGLEGDVASRLASTASKAVLDGLPLAGELYDALATSQLAEPNVTRALNAVVHPLAERLLTNVRQANEVIHAIRDVATPEPLLQRLTALIEQDIWTDAMKLVKFDAPESVTARDETCRLFVIMGDVFAGEASAGTKSMWDVALQIAPSEITRNAIREVMPKRAVANKRPWWKLWQSD
jgi:hypothetical protein